MNQFLASEADLFLLQGFAGTGKTTTIQSFIRDAQLKQKRAKVAFTAPTNKAVKVLSRMASEWNLQSVDAMTIHQLLGLQLKPSRDGGMKLEPKGIDYLSRYDLIVLDEASMVNNELWTHIMFGLANGSSAKLICMGDPAQLPPVGEEASQVFGITDVAELTEVVRQAKDNPIAELVDVARQAVYDPSVVIPKQSNRTLAEGVWWIDRQEWLHHLLAAFRSEGFQQDADRVRALAWTNRECNWLNNYVRAGIYGADASAFVEGELLIAREPIFEGDEIVLPTSSECRVLGASESLRDGYRCWNLTVLSDEGEMYDFEVLHRSERRRYLRNLGELERKARQKWTKRNWKAFFELQQQFASLDYGYAITIHKSQGSTFQNVFVVDRDIDCNPNRAEAAQCRYVAYSRAARRLFNTL
ncbi:ATP-dependent RecD-like DNA helicase [Altericista sp. CCNU0014]|uniref:ATP-dependent DNA helicase n=1 Tax=Altericista sp. CCNU0014 TaxID=3082949 RepID=UPI00384C98E9